MGSMGQASKETETISKIATNGPETPPRHLKIAYERYGLYKKTKHSIHVNPRSAKRLAVTTDFK